MFLLAQYGSRQYASVSFFLSVPRCDFVYWHKQRFVCLFFNKDLYSKSETRVYDVIVCDDLEGSCIFPPFGKSNSELIK